MSKILEIFLLGIVVLMIIELIFNLFNLFIQAKINKKELEELRKRMEEY